jgi:hypothetical protein
MVMRRLFFVLFMLGMATSSQAAKDVTLSNVTDSAVTLACIDDNTDTCQVNYGLSKGSLTLTAYDIRGSKTVSQIHYVYIDNLVPVTTYYYQLLSSNKLLSKGTFTTMAAVIPQNSYLAYGRVFNGHKPAAGCMVSLWLEDGDSKGTNDKSILSSCLTDEDGYWFYDLVNIRTQDGRGLFDFSRQGDFLYLDVLAENGIVVKTRMDTGVCMPARDLYLK